MTRQPDLFQPMLVRVTTRQPELFTADGPPAVTAKCQQCGQFLEWTPCGYLCLSPRPREAIDRSGR